MTFKNSARLGWRNQRRILGAQLQANRAAKSPQAGRYPHLGVPFVAERGTELGLELRRTVEADLHRSAALVGIAQHQGGQRTVSLVGADVGQLASLPGQYRHAIERRVMGKGCEAGDHVLAGQPHRAQHEILRAFAFGQIARLIPGPNLVEHPVDAGIARDKLLRHRLDIKVDIGIQQASLLVGLLHGEMPTDHRVGRHLRLSLFGGGDHAGERGLIDRKYRHQVLWQRPPALVDRLTRPRQARRRVGRQVGTVEQPGDRIGSVFVHPLERLRGDEAVVFAEPIDADAPSHGTKPTLGTVQSDGLWEYRGVAERPAFRTPRTGAPRRTRADACPEGSGAAD